MHDLCCIRRYNKSKLENDSNEGTKLGAGLNDSVLDVVVWIWTVFDKSILEDTGP